MSNQNEESKPGDKPELVKDSQGSCGEGCACHAAGSSGWMRWVVVVLVIAAAATLVAKGIVKNKSGCCPLAGSTVDAPVPAQMTGAAVDAASSSVVTVKELGALSDLNSVAVDLAAVFVFVPGTNAVPEKMPTDKLMAAAKTVEPQARGKIGVFRLKSGSPDHTQILAKMALPGVLAVVKGKGMAPVSGEITEVKLVQAFVAASSAGGCGSGGCGPGGCK